MKLAQMTVNEYLKLLGSDAPAPGGGSASALTGAQGAGLTAMVAALTIGKKKYEEYAGLCADIYDRAIECQNLLKSQIDLDTEAFNEVSAAYRLSRDTDEQKQARSAAIAAATLTATRVPFRTMQLALDTLKLTESLVGRSNTNAASDLGVAALSLDACVRGAWLNVLINLPGVPDGDEKNKFSDEGKAIVARSAEISKKIYDLTAE